jgi:hypothetical protein
MSNDVPQEVREIRKLIEAALNTKDDQGRTVGNAKYGVYAFYDYDGEPIYVGQTSEQLRTRIRRHLTNQRTDAVAMNVLDPFEVCEVEMVPLFDLEGASAKDAKHTLELAENTLFQKALAESSFHAVLNEKDIPPIGTMDLPKSYRAKIIPDQVYELRSHPDIRIARRAATIASLARVISERSVSKGLRRTLITQARRLEALASKRFDEVQGDVPVEDAGQDTGESPEL